MNADQLRSDYDSDFNKEETSSWCEPVSRITPWVSLAISNDSSPSFRKPLFPAAYPVDDNSSTDKSKNSSAKDCELSNAPQEPSETRDVFAHGLELGVFEADLLPKADRTKDVFAQGTELYVAEAITELNSSKLSEKPCGDCRSEIVTNIYELPNQPSSIAFAKNLIVAADDERLAATVDECVENCKSNTSPVTGHLGSVVTEAGGRNGFIEASVINKSSNVFHCTAVEDHAPVGREVMPYSNSTTSASDSIAMLSNSKLTSSDCVSESNDSVSTQSEQLLILQQPELPHEGRVTDRRASCEETESAIHSEQQVDEITADSAVFSGDFPSAVLECSGNALVSVPSSSKSDSLIIPLSCSSTASSALESELSVLDTHMLPKVDIPLPLLKMPTNLTEHDVEGLSFEKQVGCFSEPTQFSKCAETDLCSSCEQLSETPQSPSGVHRPCIASCDGSCLNKLDFMHSESAAGPTHSTETIDMERLKLDGSKMKDSDQQVTDEVCALNQSTSCEYSLLHSISDVIGLCSIETGLAIHETSSGSLNLSSVGFDVPIHGLCAEPKEHTVMDSTQPERLGTNPSPSIVELSDAGELVSIMPQLCLDDAAMIVNGSGRDEVVPAQMLLDQHVTGNRSPELNVVVANLQSAKPRGSCWFTDAQIERMLRALVQPCSAQVTEDISKLLSLVSYSSGPGINIECLGVDSSTKLQQTLNSAHSAGLITDSTAISDSQEDACFELVNNSLLENYIEAGKGSPIPDVGLLSAVLDDNCLDNIRPDSAESQHSCCSSLGSLSFVDKFRVAESVLTCNNDFEDTDSTSIDECPVVPFDSKLFETSKADLAGDVGMKIVLPFDNITVGHVAGSKPCGICAVPSFQNCVQHVQSDPVGRESNKIDDGECSLSPPVKSAFGFTDATSNAKLKEAKLIFSVTGTPNPTSSSLETGSRNYIDQTDYFKKRVERQTISTSDENSSVNGFKLESVVTSCCCGDANFGNERHCRTMLRMPEKLRDLSRSLPISERLPPLFSLIGKRLPMSKQTWKLPDECTVTVR